MVQISVSGCDIWGFPLCRLALWEFPLYRPLDGKMSLSNASTAIKNQTFSAGGTTNYFTL